MKGYDQAYFDRWYRSRVAPVTLQSRRRKVRLAVAAAEYVLGRGIRSVLDIGCGEALWRGELRRLRPEVRYQGVDSSEYVIRRFGKRRNIRSGSFATVGRLGLRRKFDLIVCADVVAYVPTPELLRGLRAIGRLLGGVAYIEAYAVTDDMIGDLEGWHFRSESTYRRTFAAAGLIACGLNCWIARAQQHLVSALERCG
jgi:SAM-dependent methyltransferase